MPTQKNITGQAVKNEQLKRARELRSEMTPAESKLWQHLRAGRLGGFHFRRQQIIDRFIVDFYCHGADLVIEVDGGVHLEQEDYDHERDRHFQERGLRVLRFTNQDVNHNLEVILTVILDACQRSGEKREPHDQTRD